MSLAFGGTDTRVFRNVASAGSPPVFERSSGLGSTDRLTVSGGQFVFRTAAGSTFTFQGHGAGIPAAARGQLLSREDASGNRLKYAFNADGSTAQASTFLASQATAQEVHTYAYLPASDPQNAGKVRQIDVTRGDGTLVRRVSFAYYGTGSSFGTSGDLMSVTVRDATGSLIDARHYRYTPAATGSLLQYTFDTDAVRRATAAGVSLATATNAAVAPFATNFYAYDAQNRVVRHDKQGAGCSACTGGIGQFTYAYAPSTRPVTDANRDWRNRLTETRPDGTQRIVYANGRGQPMLEVIRTTTGGVTTQAGTYTRYDSRGLPVWVASPEAVTLPASLAEIEQYADLLNGASGNFQYVSDASGLIEVTNYGTATTATATTPGAVDRLVESTAVRRGEFGTPLIQEAFTYVVQSSAGFGSLPVVASRTTYPNATTAGGQTTTVVSTFAPGTTRIVSQRTTLPVVATAQNGSGTAAVVEAVFDAAGREIWSRDGDGFLRYTEYDPGTGAITKTIVDVNTARSADFASLPFGWVTPVGGGLHLTSTFGVDALGRTVRATDPQGNVTLTVYDDVNQAVRVYPGAMISRSATLPTAPVQLTRRDVSGTYAEWLTYAPGPIQTWSVSGGSQPLGTEPITNLQSLTRSHFNAAGQVIAVDRYTNLDGLAYSAATATLGVEGVNYLRTRYAYNNQGQVDRVQNPAGTITISTFDGLSRITGKRKERKRAGMIL